MTREDMREAYRSSGCDDIWRAYTRPSEKKFRAYQHCLELQALMDGYDGRITRANSYRFSFAFRYMNKEDGKEHLFYITRANQYDFIYKEDAS